MQSWRIIPGPWATTFMTAIYGVDPHVCPQQNFVSPQLICELSTSSSPPRYCHDCRWAWKSACHILQWIHRQSWPPLSRLSASLMTAINGTDPHFVRCVNPNAAKQAETFHDQKVIEQLRCGGVIEAVRMCRWGQNFLLRHVANSFWFLLAFVGLVYVTLRSFALLFLYIQFSHPDHFVGAFACDTEQSLV